MQGRQPETSDEAEPMDPIALTLAVWLGLIVSVTGLVRLSENAAANAALAQAASHTDMSNALDDRPVAARVMAFGG